MGIDAVIRFGMRLGFRLMLRWWRIFPSKGEGVGIAVWHGGRVLLVRHSYRDGYGLPGGGIGRRETPAQAASRELREETRIDAAPDRLLAANAAASALICRGHTKFLFEYHAAREPDVHIDNREIVEARFVSLQEADALALNARLRRYMALSDSRERAA